MPREATLTYLSVSDAEAQNPEFLVILEAMRLSAARANRRTTSVTVPRSYLEELAGTTRAVIVVDLPSDAPLDIAHALEGPLGVFNKQSTDLLTARTILSFGNEGNVLWLDSCHMPDALDYDEEVFVIVVVRGESVWRKRFAPEDFETFVGDLSGHEACSGLNYRPYRIWSDEVLKEAALLAARKAPNAEPGTPLSLHLKSR
jgi:hypothetical protein